MMKEQNSTGKPLVGRWLHGSAVVLGLLAIAALIYVLFTTCEDHMTRAMELSRHTQWRANAPVAGAQAAALLQGMERRSPP